MQTIKPQEVVSQVGFETNVKLIDDLGNVLLDKSNAVHPQNMARVIARALANEGKSSIYRVAFGNGGTTTSAGGVITYNSPNDGQAPDLVGWQSRLYNETYSEIIDDQSPMLGSGDKAVPNQDPASTGLAGPGVRSSEQGLTSLVTIDVTLNPSEPIGQGATVTSENAFLFDELGLFTEGMTNVNTKGSQTIVLKNKTVTDNAGLVPNRSYQFTIIVNGGNPQLLQITTPLVGTGVLGQTTYITYGDILPLINTALKPLGVKATMSDAANGINAGGNMILTSNAVGPTSSVVISTDELITPLFTRLIGFVEYATPVNGALAGVQNDSLNSDIQRERLLTHIIFEPIIKAADRTIRLVYTLSISVARSQ